MLDAGGLTQPAQARLVAIPTPDDGVRPAWETSLIDNDASPRGVSSFVDAETGEVLIREELVDHLADNPTWNVFPANPRLDYTSTDTRQRWCWLATANCQLVVGNPSSPFPWDVDARSGLPTFTTQGNNSFAVHNWNSTDPFTVGTERATPKIDREYNYPWTNQWREARCNPSVFTSPQRNDIDAARANLFVMHNRMHDWSYALGFTETAWNMQSFNFGRGGLENDLEQGNAQAGAIGPARVARQRQPDHRPRRHRADHEHVPLAADRGRLLRPVRGRRLRHVGDRARVHARDLQPHGGRAGRRPVRRPGGRDGRELVRPRGDPVPARQRLRAAWRTRTRSRSVRTRPATRWPASATTR